ncbi:hypothetical protein BS47DRAFT_575469 [Hydnum rufescens UP504]|uniref:Ammonium transporter AmtB-like domain-containing protein n=1 Tax=Hydnum rufescens UP504 TaxID=1448309 RepID=A0A9P6AFV2_9AGAM|nr:hypothetical protein BS47DRAFT_575469 [Hydnum rufescens UP504]
MSGGNNSREFPIMVLEIVTSVAPILVQALDTSTTRCPSDWCLNVLFVILFEIAALNATVMRPATSLDDRAPGAVSTCCRTYWIGSRLSKDRLKHKPHIIPLVVVGAGVLWNGWNGFNGGDPCAVSTDAGAAVLNTNIATATSALVWIMWDTIYYKKSSVLGGVNGMITGLVAITPAAGVVVGWGAMVIGIVSGSLPWITMNIAGKKLSLFHHVDNTLGVFHIHLVAGVCGDFLVGASTSERDAAFNISNPGGGIDGNDKQIGWQLTGACFVIGGNTVWTSLILPFIKHVLRMPEVGLLISDDAIHGVV